MQWIVDEGNAPLDQTLVNLSLMGIIDNDLTALNEYMRKAHEYVEVALPRNYPVFGEDAFETGTGVHASAAQLTSTLTLRMSEVPGVRGRSDWRISNARPSQYETSDGRTDCTDISGHSSRWPHSSLRSW